MRSILERLDPDEAQRLLIGLLEARPSVRPTVETLVRRLVRSNPLQKTDFKAVAARVVTALGNFGVADLQGRSGRTQLGYIEPSQAAWDILEDAVRPFLDNMHRQVELGLGAEALETCKGVAMGLYRIEHARDPGLIGWAPDFAAETTAGAIAMLRAGRRSRKRAAKRTADEVRHGLSPEFIREFVPKWAEMLTRIQSDSRPR